MSTTKFKTNLKCSGCVDAVTPHLNKVEQIEKWEVDLNNPDRTLLVEGDDIEQEVVSALKSAGYTAERIG